MLPETEDARQLGVLVLGRPGAGAEGGARRAATTP